MASTEQHGRSTAASLEETAVYRNGFNAPASEADDHEDRMLIGTELDVYRVESLLGKGGMGRVYLARHRDLHRPCALKILSPRLAAEDEDYVSRFLNEGRAAAALVHPNIITIHAIGQEQLHYFLEMEFIPGRSLRQVVADEGRLSPSRAVALAARIADGLAAAHRANIVHQDLKPDNVLMTLQGIPKIADFGLAKRLRRGESALPDDLCGTPQFMAPELFQGSPAAPASDVYALGVTLFQMLTGRFPFAAETLPALMPLVATEPVPNIRQWSSGVSLEVAECVNLLMEKSPANRPQDGLQAAQLLYATLGQEDDLDKLLADAFRDDNRMTWTRDGERYRLTMRLPGGRFQTLFIEQSEHAVAERLLLIYSTCCPVVPAYYETALRLNAEMPHGSIAVREVEGVPQFVVLDTYPRATVDAEEIRRSAHTVASRADAIEKLLTGVDRH